MRNKLVKWVKRWSRYFVQSLLLKGNQRNCRQGLKWPRECRNCKIGGWAVAMFRFCESRNPTKSTIVWSKSYNAWQLFKENKKAIKIFLIGCKTHISLLIWVSDCLKYVKSNAQCSYRPLYVGIQRFSFHFSEIFLVFVNVKLFYSGSCNETLSLYLFAVVFK